MKRLVSYGGVPAYLQVAEVLRQRIVTGDLRPGDKLPSIADLTRQFQVSKMVAAMAIKELHQTGWIYGHQGKGTFVRERKAMRRRSAVWYTRPTGDKPRSPTARSVIDSGGTAAWDHESAHATADAAVAVRLAVDEGAPVMRTSYVFRADGEPIHLSTSWEPLDVTGGTDIEWPEEGAAVGVVARFDVLGIRIDTVDEVVSARMPTQAERDALKMAAGVPVIVIERTFAADGRPMETADVIIPADRQQLHYGIPVT